MGDRRDGSTDGTLELANDLAADFPWIGVLSVPKLLSSTCGAPIVSAFEAGLATLDPVPAVVFKLDADVSFEPTHFERLLDALARRPRLGSLSSTCFDVAGGGERFATGQHVWGAVRGYRAECLPDVLPLEGGMGWDTVDEVKARLAGWETEVVPDVVFSIIARKGAARDVVARLVHPGPGSSLPRLPADLCAREDSLLRLARARGCGNRRGVCRRRPRAATSRRRPPRARGASDGATLAGTPRRAREALGSPSLRRPPGIAQVDLPRDRSEPEQHEHHECHLDEREGVEQEHPQHERRRAGAQAGNQEPSVGWVAAYGSAVQA